MPNKQKKQQIIQTIEIFGPILSSVFENIHNTIQNKNNLSSGLFLLEQGVSIIDCVIHLFSILCKFKKQKFIILIIQILHDPFLIWFTNPKPRNPDLTAGECDKLRTSIEKLWKSFTQMISTCKDPCHEKELLFSIEFMLTTAFKSKFRWLKNAAVTFWNSIFSEYSSEFPKGFYEILKDLKKQIGSIQIPEIIDDDNDDIDMSIEEDSLTEENSIGNEISRSEVVDSLPIPDEENVTSYSTIKNDKKLAKTKKTSEIDQSLTELSTTDDDKSSVVELESLNNDMNKDDGEDVFLPPNPVSLTGTKRKRQPLTESQKEKRRDQQKTSLLFGGKVPAATLTTQEIADELWGDVDENPTKKRKLDKDVSIDIYPSNSIDRKFLYCFCLTFFINYLFLVTSYSTVDYINLLKQLCTEEQLPSQLSTAQLLDAQRSLNKLMQIFIEKIEDNNSVN